MIVEIRDEVVALSGALVQDQWHALQSAVNIRLRHHPRGIVVDCGGLTALTPEGAETFRRAARHIAASGARIVVANIPSDVMWIIRRTPDLGSQLPIAATVAEARASLGLAAAPRRHAGETPRAIVVGLLGIETDAHGVAVACRLGQTPRASPDEGITPAAPIVYLTYLLLVPRNVPLFSAMGPEEEAAQAELERWDNAVRAARLRPVRRVEHTRDRAKRLVQIAGEFGAETIVLALPADPTDEIIAVARETLAHAPCDVVVNRLPEPTAAPPQTATRLAPFRYDSARGGRG